MFTSQIQPVWLASNYSYTVVLVNFISLQGVEEENNFHYFFIKYSSDYSSVGENVCLLCIGAYWTNLCTLYFYYELPGEGYTYLHCEKFCTF